MTAAAFRESRHNAVQAWTVHESPCGFERYKAGLVHLSGRAMTTQIPVNGRDLEPLLLSRLCDRGAALQPDNLIITRTPSGYVTQTYAEHRRRAKQLGSALTKWGVNCEDRVATLMWNTGWHFECYHAIACIGAVLHTLNLRLNPSDLEYIISHAQDRVIIVDAVLCTVLKQIDAVALASVELFVFVGEDGEAGKWSLPPEIDARKAIDYDAFLASGDQDFEWPLVPETSTMGLCYTSGTTGRPKGGPGTLLSWASFGKKHSKDPLEDA
eukprot:s1334_g15.t1